MTDSYHLKEKLGLTDLDVNPEVKKHAEICRKLNAVYEQKNRAYGNSFHNTFEDLGIISAVTRISDKFNRLKNLAKNPNVPNGDESIADTLVDMANYCIMTYMEVMANDGRDDSGAAH